MNNHNNQNIQQYQLSNLVAQSKFALIAPIISGTYFDDTIGAYFKRVAKHDINWPDGTKRKFSYQTLNHWLYLYRKYGIDGLAPKNRLDIGSSRKNSATHKEVIHNLIKEFPKITGVMVYEKMIAQGVVNKNEISVDTIQRYIKNSGIRSSSGPLIKERRTWEYAHACDGYEADTCHTFHNFDEQGEYRKTYLIAMIDIHSRLIVGAEFFFNDNAVNFQKLWKNAVLRYGRSSVLILDNGSSYKNKSTTEIEAKLGTKLIYNPPYSPVGKAVIERFLKL